MGISYRVTTGLALAILILTPAYNAVFKKAPTVSSEGEVTFDLCTATWEQMSPIRQIAGLVTLPVLLAVFVQGIRNRSILRVVPIAALVGLIVLVQHDRWRMVNCWTAWSYMELAAIIVMCIHQLLPRVPHPIESYM
jgi:hypothetical protein